MLPRIEAEETQRQMRVAMASNGRTLSDGDRDQFQREIMDKIGQQPARPRAPKASLGFLRDAGVNVMEGGEG